MAQVGRNCREMTVEMDGPLREEREGSAPERQQTLIDLFGSQPKVAADDSTGLEGTGSKLCAVGDASPSREAGFSRDPVDTYFRQLRNAELLSREDEVALAKRIEAAEVAVLKGLCSVPVLIERLEQWGSELREGRLRLRDLIDLSMYHEVARHGGTIAEPDALDQGGVQRGKPRDSVARGSWGEHEDADDALDREASLLAGMTTLLDRLSTLAHEIGPISRKRVSAVSRGRDLSKSARARLQELFSSFAGELGSLWLHPDRISDLLAELEREQQNLRDIEQELLRLAGRCGITRRDVLDRYLGHELDPHWLRQAGLAARAGLAGARAAACRPGAGIAQRTCRDGSARGSTDYGVSTRGRRGRPSAAGTDVSA